MRRKRPSFGASGIGHAPVPGEPAARIAARNAAVASAQRSASAPSGGPEACPVASARVAGSAPASHSARVGSRSTAARLRPHAAQNTAAPGGSPQNGHTRTVASIAGHRRTPSRPADRRPCPRARKGG